LASARKRRKKFPMTGKERLRAAFREDRVALIPYLTAGYPTLDGAREVGEAYVEAGADVVEIGVPFSDPLADGPTIQDTTTRALENGANLDYCLGLASEFSGRVPVVFLLYYNIIFARGVEEFLDEVAGAGVSGLVVPDLPVDEAGRFAERSAERGVAFCPLAAPTSTDERLARVGEAATGFVYCVSVAGVTGARDALPPGAVELLGRVRSRTDAPVALGFGIGSAEAAAEAAAAGADGIIIGSKLMQLVGEDGPERASEWLRGIRRALSDASPARHSQRRSQVGG
jgi:tryptophan synthase alpha chain